MDEDEESHFEPPIPQPTPRADPVTRWAWAGVLFAPLSVVVAAIFSWTPSDEFVIFIAAAFIAGFVTLIARKRDRNPYDPDDGAQV